MKRHSRVTAALIAAALVAPVSGCSALFTPQATEIKYAGGDGAAASIGDVDVRDVLVITRAKGEPGQLLGSVVNTSKSPKSVTLSTPNSNTTVRVKPDSVTKIDPKEGKDVRIPSVSVNPGHLIDVTMKSGSTTRHFEAQVLNGELPQYKKYLPKKSKNS